MSNDTPVYQPKYPLKHQQAEYLEKYMDHAPPAQRHIEKNTAVYIMYTPVYIRNLKSMVQRRTRAEARHTPMHLKS